MTWISQSPRDIWSRGRFQEEIPASNVDKRSSYPKKRFSAAQNATRNSRFEEGSDINVSIENLLSCTHCGNELQQEFYLISIADRTV